MSSRKAAATGSVEGAGGASAAVRGRLKDVRRAVERVLDAGSGKGEARAVHALRVACRRADTTVRALAGGFEASAVEAVRRRLKRVRRRAGLVRDADVQAEALAALREGAGGSVRRAMREVRRARDQDAARLRRWLEGGAASRLERESKRLLASAAEGPKGAEMGPAGVASVASFARAALEASRQRLEEPERLHAFRIALKRVRYAIETFESSLDAGLVREVSASLRRAQRELGRITDAERLVERLNELGVRDGVRDAVAGEAASLHAAFVRDLGASGLIEALERCAGPGGEEGGAPAERVLAAIDVGSNAVRLRVEAVGAGGRRRVLAEDRRPTRLGSGLSSGGRLPEAGVAATVAALRGFAEASRRLGAQRIEAVATAAVRESADGAAFVRRVKREAGLDLRVIDGREEAALALRSAVSAARPGPDERLGLIDIGGGSVEVGVSIGGVVARMVSMPLGAVRLTDAFGGPKASSGPRFAAMVRHINAVLDERLGEGLVEAALRPGVVCGSGGTFTTLALMEPGRAGAGRASVSRRRVRALLGLLRKTPVERRVEVAGLTPDRADIIVAGLAVLDAVLGRLGAQRVMVVEGGVREGMILRMLEPAEPGAGGAAASALRFGERARFNREHARRVAGLALEMLAGLRGAGPRAQDSALLLECGALLHDVGCLVSYARHHKHGESMVLHAPLEGLSEEQRGVVASLARYHRRGGPPEDGDARGGHATFVGLPGPRRAQARLLAGVLRVADGLDRAHEGAVGRASVRVTARRVEVTAHAAEGSRAAAVRAGVRAAREKSDVLAAALGREVVVKSGGAERAAIPPGRGLSGPARRASVGKRGA